MAKITSKFKLIIKAGNVQVAESDDTELCLKVLNAISKKEGGSQDEATKNTGFTSENDDFSSESSDDAVASFAKKIGVTVDQAIGACDPQSEDPFITLAPNYWEALKKNTGRRGKNSVASAVLALTLLNIWFSVIKKGEHPTQALAQSITTTLGDHGKNISRSVKNCEWLQSKGNGVSIDPSEYSQAIALAKLYITKGASEAKKSNE